MKPDALTIKQQQLKLEALQGGIAYFQDKAKETRRWMEEVKPIPEVLKQMQHNVDIYQRAEQRLCRQAAIVCRQMAHEYDVKGQNHDMGSIFLIEKGWIDPLENRNADGYEPFGFKLTEQEAKDFCLSHGHWTGRDCYSIHFKPNKIMSKYRYKEIRYCR